MPNRRPRSTAAAERPATTSLAHPADATSAFACVAALELVFGEQGFMIPFDAVRAWTDECRAEAYEWATGRLLDERADDPPAFVADALRKR